VTAKPQNGIATSRDQQQRKAAASLLDDAGQSQDGLDRAKIRDDQPFIAKFVMWVFGISICASIVAVTLAPLVTPDWKDLVPLMLDIIKVGVVPMVALVIGYYLPKSGR
jgi:hypothetical protein